MFKNLIVLDIANNHNGDIKHGLQMVRAFAFLIKKYQGVFELGIKIQLRNLDKNADPPFIHPHNREDKGGYIERFLSTALSYDEHNLILGTARDMGFKTLATPLDERSVTEAVTMNVDFLKVASCSALDWPLLREISKQNKPVILSTGGLNEAEVSKAVAFLTRHVDLAINYCIPEYPTAIGSLGFDNLRALISKYPRHTIGWSTHEPPDCLMPGIIAYTMGARTFERHIQIPSQACLPNQYSSAPEQIDRWLYALRETKDAIDTSAFKYHNLDKLKRGIYLKNNIAGKTCITPEDVFYAMPLLEGQMKAGDLKKDTTAYKPLKALAPLLTKDKLPDPGLDNRFKVAATFAISLLEKANIHLHKRFQMTYSYHKGRDLFLSFGVIMTTVIKERYCKKLLFLYPGQSHPEHYHTYKHETFQLLYGDVTIVTSKDKIKTNLDPGETLTVNPFTNHSFSSVQGCILEEISTMPQGLSVYTDDNINMRADRKLTTIGWGYQSTINVEKS